MKNFSKNNFISFKMIIAILKRRLRLIKKRISLRVKN